MEGIPRLFPYISEKNEAFLPFPLLLNAPNYVSSQSVATYAHHVIPDDSIVIMCLLGSYVPREKYVSSAHVPERRLYVRRERVYL